MVDPLPEGSAPYPVLLPIIRYAERFPMVPIRAVVDCLLDVVHESGFEPGDPDWTAEVEREATSRLSSIEAVLRRGQIHDTSS